MSGLLKTLVGIARSQQVIDYELAKIREGQYDDRSGSQRSTHAQLLPQGILGSNDGPPGHRSKART